MFIHVTSKLGIGTFSVVRARYTPRTRALQWTIASSTLVGCSLYALSQKPVYNDGPAGENISRVRKQDEDVGYSPLVWGSNQNHLITPDQDSKNYIKFPTYAPKLFSNPLRDLAFSAQHAACVDAAGNVYQWGDGFFGSTSTKSRGPHLTLRGKNIVSLAVTPTKVFALSVSGKIYALPASLQSSQAAEPISKSWWNIFSSGDPDPSVFKILDTDVRLLSGERFTSISAGSDHLLALTSNGRAFTHPINRRANLSGQLGLRKITVPDLSDPTKRTPVELVPKSIRDTYANRNKASPDLYVPPTDLTDERTEDKDEFCDRLFEIAVLRGLDVQQVVAGERTSFAVTRRDGRVLGWGANEYGQLGLGANVTLPSVTVPTEVVLSKGTPGRCVNIATGGDLTLFTVQKDLPGGGSQVVNVFACGNGQWGGLGNATFSNAQGAPVKVKNISGILEYDEQTNSLKPLRPRHISVAPGPIMNDTGTRTSSGHVIATLDTIPLSHPDPKSQIAADAANSPGRDVLVWGLNQHYQLGNGRRSGANIPASISTGDDEGRLMCKIGRGRVTDFDGKVVGKNVKVEQNAVAGPGVSVIYWKVL